MSGRLCEHSPNTDFQVFKTFSLSVWLSLLMSIVVVGATHRFLGEENYWNIGDQLVNDILMSFKMLFSQNCLQLNSPCTLKNIFLLGISLHAFHWLMQWFRTFMLSNLLFEPIIQIDSIEDLHNVVKLLHSQRPQFHGSGLQRTLSMALNRNSKENNFRNVFKLLTNDKQFGYQQIYEGKRVASASLVSSST